jgi:recombinational DNA repair ATPase RecF
MKITKITITNYRSCVKTTFQPHRNLSALIGPNGSGKTNTMSAIRLLSALCFRTPTRYSLDKPSPAGNSLSIVKTWYEIDSKKLIHTAKLNLVNNEKNQDEIIDAEEF